MVQSRIMKLYMLIEDKWPHKPARNGIKAPSGRLTNAVKFYRKVRKNGSEMQIKAYNSEIVRDTAKDKCTAASKASLNFSSEEYRQSCRIKLLV